tara:strand:- start:117 stop:665 length:549 start_codon:yes stop_codon:yes gene_type:complete
MSEARKLQYIFKQKEVERLTIVSERQESDAEHIYGCLILSEYFLEKESLKHIDKQRVFEIFLFHDLVENETGDISAYKKTAEDGEKEKEAINIVKNKIPEKLTPIFSSRVDEYEEQTTIEARFCKAVDKLEPVIQMLDGIDYVRSLGITKEMTHNIKAKYIKEFPDVYEVYQEAMDILFGNE